MKSFVMKIAWKAYYLLPPSLRQILKNILKSGGGHKNSGWNSQIAYRDASGKMSLENSVDTFCQYLDALGIQSLENKDCLEIGTGYVGTHSLVMWLLGANTVTASDLNNIIVPEALHKACINFNKDKIFAKLKKYASSNDSLHSRLDIVCKWSSSKFQNQQDFFNYIAPCNIIEDNPLKKYDFIFSVSVLEHISPSIIEQFLKSLFNLQKGQANCVHFIDLTDHFDHEKNPLGFLDAEHIEYNEDEFADSRGNRIRSLAWIELFEQIYSKPISYETEKVHHSFLPKNLLSQYKNINEDVLLDKSILIRAHKD